ncbi:hypothetical protein [Plantactinospora sp. WMMB782]|uniref:hypothetical protein n=1 Tax=Plantactinospora sp. WMMB782 TaxID=3404121 RepID=UPI003B92C75E
MLKARRISTWRNRFEVSVQDRVVTTWDSGFWRNTAEFDLDGRRYQMRGNAWGTRYAMVDAAGGTVASAERVGRKRWTVEADGQTYHFQRASLFSSEQELHTAGHRVGSVKRTSFWRGDVLAELPGLSLPVQIFTLGVVIMMWNQEAAAAAAS